VTQPPSALTPVSLEVSRAAAAAFSGRAWAASALFFLPAVLLAGFMDREINSIQEEGRRRVLQSGTLFIQVLAGAGLIAVQVRRARERVEGIDPELRTLGPWWLRSLPVALALAGAFIVVWVALGGLIESIGREANRNLLRIFPLILAFAAAAYTAGLAVVATWLPAIRAIEGCPTGPAASILRTLWAKARGRLALHVAVAGIATWLAWMAAGTAVSIVYSWAGSGPGYPATFSAVLYDDVLRRWLALTPPLAVLASSGVASYLLLRPLNGAAQ
jgi:hypothetical protein